MNKLPVYGAIEGGGTKFVCAVGPSYAEQLESTLIATGDPAASLQKIVEFFQNAENQHGSIDHSGIGMFGPMDLQKGSADRGKLLNTPKLAWRGVNIVEVLAKKFKAPISITTDVDCAALGEERLGAAQGGTSSI